MAIAFTAPSTEASPEFPRPWIFLAGGITNCPDWQSELIEHPAIKEKDCTLINPRQKNFDINNPLASVSQISWEFSMLSAADAITFWFARGSDNPIVLLEYGLWLGKKSGMAGVDPQYSRRQDVLLQTSLYCQDMPVYEDWETFVEALCLLVDSWREEACLCGLPLLGQAQAQA